MQKPKQHIFVCASFRFSGEQQGVCHKKGAGQWLAYLENEIADRNLDGITVTATGCLKVCDRGPALVVYPENTWYGKLDSTAALDEILDALEAGAVCEKYLLT